MATADTTHDTHLAQDPDIGDEFIRAAEDAEAEHGGIRNLFDLRTIIGGLFVVYGIYLTIRGIFDSQAAVDQAAGVRINLWTGLAALLIGGAFLAWALLRPLTLDEIVEGQAASLEEEQAHDALREERERSVARPRH
jgi:hypothetical protein